MDIRALAFDINFNMNKHRQRLLFLILIMSITATTSQSQNNKSQAHSASLTKVIFPKQKSVLHFELIQPLSTRYITSIDSIDIHYRIHSDIPISPGNVLLLVNDVIPGEKGNIVSLLGTNNLYDYRRRIKLIPGMNLIQIVVEVGSENYKSPELELTNGIKQKHITNISWIEPDPFLSGGERLSQSESSLPFEVQITTSESIHSNEVAIIINDQTQSLSPKATVDHYDGRVRIKDVIDLRARRDGELHIRIQLNSFENPVRSSALILDYHPFKPNLHVVSIGTKTNLAYTVKDAMDFANLYSRQEEGSSLFNQVNINLVTGKHAETNEIRGVIEELQSQMKYGLLSESDILLIFISSHGFVLDNDFRIQGEDYNPMRQVSTSVSYSQDIIKPLNNIKCKKLLFMDACNSGGAKSPVSEINEAIQTLSQTPEGLTVISSSMSDESSYEDDLWKNGAFTEVLIQGLGNGLADLDANNIITIHEIFEYLEQQVPKIVLDVKNELQHPTLIRDELGDIPIYLIKN